MDFVELLLGWKSTISFICNECYQQMDGSEIKVALRTYTYIYIYIRVCVCVCMCTGCFRQSFTLVLQMLLYRRICSSTVRNWRSLRITVFGTYQGASTIICRYSFQYIVRLSAHPNYLRVNLELPYSYHTTGDCDDNWQMDWLPYIYYSVFLLLDMGFGLEIFLSSLVVVW
jgi:hypothetical protein